MHTSLYSVCSEAIRVLNVNSVPESSIVNTLARNGIATIQKLKETDIDQVGNGTAKGLKVTLIGTRA